MLNFDNCSLVCSIHIAQLRAQTLYCNKSWQTTTPWPNPLLLCTWQVFSAAATKGWAWYSRDLMQRWRNVRDSQEAQASGREWMLGIPKRKGENGFQQISFRQCITFCKHRQLKGWQPRFQLREAATIFHRLPAVAYIVYICTKQPRILLSKSWIPQLYLLQAWCNHHAELMERAAALRNLGREWMLWIPKRNGRDRFLRQTCRINRFSAVYHILGTSAAQRLAATHPTHCC